MRWWLFESPTPETLQTAPSLLDQALDTVTPLVTALTTALDPTLTTATFIPLLLRWAAMCWDLPASAAHHHSRPFGLLHHSLEVATHALTAFTHSSLWWQKVPEAAARHRTQERWRLGTALAGLLHDAGKLFDVSVTLPPATPVETSSVWNPLAEPLLTFLHRHQQGERLPTPVLHWQPGRGMQHEAAGALAATLVLTRDDLVVLTLPVARELWAFLSGSPDPRNVFYQLIVQSGQPASPAADGTSVRTDLVRTPPASPSLAARVLATLGQCCQDGTLRVNQFPGQVFVQGDETLVVVPAALHVVRERLASQGFPTPEGIVLYNDLAAAGYILGPPGQNVAQALVERPGKAPATLAVLRFPNPLLWGTTPPGGMNGALAIRLVDDPAVVPS